jgi:hypothetical protein
MHKLRNKRILALVVGIGLMIALPCLLWAGISLSSQSSSLVYTVNSWVFTLLTLALEPIIVGGIVGTWIRGGSDHPWLRASGFGALVWWLLLFVLFIAVFLWVVSQIPTSPPDPSYYGGSGPQPGYGLGIFLGASIFYGGAYAVVGLPFILLGAALTYPRRGVVYSTHSANRTYR